MRIYIYPDDCQKETWLKLFIQKEEPIRINVSSTGLSTSIFKAMDGFETVFKSVSGETYKIKPITWDEFLQLRRGHLDWLDRIVVDLVQLNRAVDQILDYNALLEWQYLWPNDYSIGVTSKRGESYLINGGMPTEDRDDNYCGRKFGKIEKVKE